MCTRCLIKQVFDPHNRGNGRYCLECKVEAFEEASKRNRPILQGTDRTREKVRVRDKYMCQDCGKKWIEGNRRFDVHHLNGLCGKKSKKYDKISDMGGLITLCHKCHFNRPEHKSNRKLLT